VNSAVFGKDNVISGIGFRAVDSRAGATPPRLSGSNTANWAYARKGTVLTYLEFHPLAVLWLSIAFLVIAGGLWVRRRRPPLHPYPESTRWRGLATEPEHVPVPLDVSVGAAAGPVPVGAQVGAASVGADVGPVLAGAQVGLAVGERVDLAAAGERGGPPWSLDHDEWPEGGHPYRGPFEANGVAPRRGPFEPALPDAAPLDALPLDGGAPGGRRPGDTRSEPGPLDAPRLDDGPLGGRRREDVRRDSARLDAPRLDSPRLHGGQLDPAPEDGGRLDHQRPDAEQLEPTRLDPAASKDARPYGAQADGRWQPSRHSRSEPIDSTKPLPQVEDRQ
jgi:hypothetical protein